MDSLFHQSMTWVMENDITGALDLSFTVSEEIFGEVRFFYSRDTYYGWTQSPSSWWTRVLYSSRRRLPVQMLSEFKSKALFVSLEHKELNYMQHSNLKRCVSCWNSLWVSSPFGEVLRSHARAACVRGAGKERESSPFLRPSRLSRSLARSHVLSCFASLAVNGELASRLLLEVRDASESMGKFWG